MNNGNGGITIVLLVVVGLVQDLHRGLVDLHSVQVVGVLHHGDLERS